jgi:hypothetical protein
VVHSTRERRNHHAFRVAVPLEAVIPAVVRDRAFGPVLVGVLLAGRPLPIFRTPGMRAPRFRPQAFEVLALVSFVAAIVTLRLCGLRVTLATVEFTVRETGFQFLRVFAFGILLNLLYRAWPRGRRQPYIRALRDLSWLFGTLRIWFACVLVAHAYMWLKVAIPLLNRRVWDVELARFDQALHGGISPSRFFVALFEDTVLLPVVDWSYAVWLPLALAMLGLFATSASPRVRAQFLFSHVAIWTLGVWCYIAMPAIGPGLAFPEEWRSTRAALPRTVEAQVKLLQNYERVVESRSSGVLRAGFNPGYGVAAMPSLHVAVDWLLLLWCFRRARAFAGLFLAAFLLTFLGSVVTGWHYAVDGYVGIAMAQLSFWLAQKVSLDLPDPPETDPPPAPHNPADAAAWQEPAPASGS